SVGSSAAASSRSATSAEPGAVSPPPDGRAGSGLAGRKASASRESGGGRRRKAARQHAAGVKAVASAAGVSLGTVSNVLNRPEVVSPVTRAKVEAAMASLGFVRNESARQLRAGSSRILAYLMLDAGNPF